MLIHENASVRWRVLLLLGAAATFAAIPAAGYIAVNLCGATFVGGSSRVGLALGVFAALIIGFEMLLWPREFLRGYRWFGRARNWMLLHIWLGLLCLPLAVGHSGFRFGGLLPAILMIVFLLVIASGVWGLLLQQILPQRLLDEFPFEAIESEIDGVMRYHAERVTGFAAADDDPLTRFFRDEVKPYLLGGRPARPALASASRAAERFTDLLERYPDREEALSRLRNLCDARAVYDRQARIHAWLHNWLWVHVPLSVVLCVLLTAHIVTALKYW